MSITVSFDASGLVQAGGSASLSGGATGDLSAAGGGEAAGSAGLDGASVGDIAAAGAGAAGGTATVKATVALTGAGFVHAMGAGVLAVQVPLSAFVAADASGVATLADADVILLVRTPGFVAHGDGRSFRVSRRGVMR